TPRRRSEESGRSTSPIPRSPTRRASPAPDPAPACDPAPEAGATRPDVLVDYQREGRRRFGVQTGGRRPRVGNIRRRLLEQSAVFTPEEVACDGGVARGDHREQLAAGGRREPALDAGPSLC